MSVVEKLIQDRKICDIHVKRLKKAIINLKSVLPIDGKKLQRLNDNELGQLEILTSRFAKLQDVIGDKIFKTLLLFYDNAPKKRSIIDVLNQLEKLDIIESVEFWNGMRDARNHITHEYPDDFELMSKHINDVVEKSKVLVKFWTKLKKEIAKHVK